MRYCIRNISLLILLLVFITSTTGFTLYIHFCNCFKTTKYVMFQEIVKSDPDCCCESKLPHQHDEDTHDLTIQNSDCCENINVLVKSISFIPPFSVKFSELVHLKTLVVAYLFEDTRFLQDEIINKSLTEYYFPPPLLYGKALIISFKQFKIPFIS